MLQLENLGKRYAGHLVFEGLTHAFSPGCYALCEEDSTGKSTLLRLIAGVLKSDTGDVVVEGHSMTRSESLAKARVAYVPDDCMAFPDLTGRDLLSRAAKAKNTKVDESVFQLADDLGLSPHLDKRFEQMSTGTRRKVYLTAAAIGSPAVIVADGPSDGLDKPARVALAARLREWAEERVVLFATYDAELVEATGARLLRVVDLH